MNPRKSIESEKVHRLYSPVEQETAEYLAQIQRKRGPIRDFSVWARGGEEGREGGWEEGREGGKEGRKGGGEGGRDGWEPREGGREREGVMEGGSEGREGGRGPSFPPALPASSLGPLPRSLPKLGFPPSLQPSLTASYTFFKTL